VPASWIFVLTSWIFVLLGSWTFVVAQTALPPGALTLINEDKYGSLVALCADTGEPTIRQGPKTIRATGVWVGRGSNLRRVHAGRGACDPAWSPDGRRLAVTSAEGLWVIPATAAEGTLRVHARIPLGEPIEHTYRAFSDPEWSPDGLLVGLLVTNGATSWVEVFEVATGRLLYTSPPGNDSFSWGRGRALRLRSAEIHLSYGR
jgi:dipeptidyl aminopeptidase/acylaminoacyl peptidase